MYENGLTAQASDQLAEWDRGLSFPQALRHGSNQPGNGRSLLE
jgi:hypothetical protein